MSAMDQRDSLERSSTEAPPHSVPNTNGLSGPQGSPLGTETGMPHSQEQTPVETSPVVENVLRSDVSCRW